MRTLAEFEHLGVLKEEFGDGFELAAKQAGVENPECTTNQRKFRGVVMKYLDEFSDPELARKLVDQIKSATSQRWSIMEVCGGQTHSIIRHGIDQLLPDTIEMIHGPGCPVCVTPLEIIDKALEIASRPGVIFCSFGDMLRVPGSDEGPVPGQERGRRRPGGVLAAGRAEDRAGQPGQAGGVLRHRLRDDGAGQRDDRLRGQTAWYRELLAAGVARAGAAGHLGDHGVADVPRSGIPGRRARLHGDGHRRVPTAVRQVRDPDRRHRVRAARHPRGHPAHGAAAGVGQARAGERLSARGPGRGQPGREGDAARRLRRDRPGVARHRHDPEQRLAAVARLPRLRRRAPVRGRPTSTPRSRRCAGPARCCRA